VISRFWEATTAKRMKTRNVRENVVANQIYFPAVYRLGLRWYRRAFFY